MIDQLLAELIFILLFTLAVVARQKHPVRRVRRATRRTAAPRAERTRRVKAPKPTAATTTTLAPLLTAAPADDDAGPASTERPWLGARVRRGLVVRRNRRLFNKRLMPNGKPTPDSVSVLKPRNPYEGERFPAWARVFGTRADGRNRLLQYMGYYMLNRQGLRTTTRQAEVLCPINTEPSLGHKGSIVGVEILSATAQIFDGHENYGADLMNGNVLVVGDPGGGKSSLLKTVFCWRPLRMGRQVAVIDSKKQLRIDESTGERRYTGEGEWATLAHALGIKVVTFNRRNGTIINPLDPRFGRDTTQAVNAADKPDQDESNVLGQDTLLRTLIQVPLKRDLLPNEHYALTCAHNRAIQRAAAENREAILADVFYCLTHPVPEDAARYHGRTVQDLAEWGENIAMTLDRMITGDLRGIADGETSRDIDFDAPLLVFDVSSLDPETDAMPMVMALIGTLLRNVWLREDDDVKRIFIVDEGWHVIGNPSTARMFRRLWKFCRALGLVNVAALHRLSDLPGVEQQGSEARALLDEAATRIAYHLDSTNAEQVGRVFGLPGAATREIRSLGRGQAVWSIGRRPARIVQTHRTTLEERLTNTDEAMTGQAA